MLHAEKQTVNTKARVSMESQSDAHFPFLMRRGEDLVVLMATLTWCTVGRRVSRDFEVRAVHAVHAGPSPRKLRRDAALSN